MSSHPHPARRIMVLRGRGRGRGPRDVAGSFVSALTAAALLSGCGGPAGETAASGASATTALPTAGNGSEVGAGEWADRRRAAAIEVLTNRTRAVLAEDATAYLASTRAGGERERDEKRFERMVALDLSDLRLISVEEIAPPVPVGVDAAAMWDVEAAFEYRISGFDRIPRRFVLGLTVTATPSRPDDLTITASRPADRPQPWDIEGMQVRRSDVALVVGSGAGADLDEVLDGATRAARRVSAVWGTVVPAVWVVPAGAEDAELLLGRAPDGLEGVAAATDGPLEAGQPAGADRIVLSPPAWSSLSPLGRDVVMVHELTHVAVRASTTRAVPLWLSEGFAEYVAYRTVDLPDRTVSSSLVTRLREEGLPEHLPGSERFDPGTGPIAAAYAEAWLAVSSLVETHGQAAVVSFYHVVAGGLDGSPPGDPKLSPPGDPEAAVDEALGRVLGTTRAELERAWLTRLRALLR